MKSVARRDSPLQGQSLFIFTILVVGLSGIVTQVMLLRELLVSFYGNELTLGIILSNWLISEALGVFVIGKFIDKIKNKMNVFILLQIIFSLTLPLSVYLSRTFKELLGIPFAEAVGLSTIFCSSFLIILPVSFCHGALFSAGCKIYSLNFKESASSIGKVYTLETTGTIIGGIILTYLFIPYLNSFQIVSIISIANLIICLFFFRDTTKILKYTALSIIFLGIYFSLSGGINYIHSISIKKQWKNQEILDYRNSVYGNIAVTKQLKQNTFFYNGIPIITTPHPDITFVQEFGHLPLLYHRAPRDILIVSGGAGGLINEILKHPIKKIDYVELDPLIIDMLKRYHSDLTQREFSDKRVNIINRDGRFFVKNTSNQYDIVLVGLSKPSDLSTNRFFTQEFFALVKKRLKPDGILAFWLPGSLTYLSQELKDVNICILNALKATYNYMRIIPGDYNIFLASSSLDIMKVNPALILQRITQQNIETAILKSTYLDYRLNARWLDWFMRSLHGATKNINQDLRPFAVFAMLIFWNKQFSPRLIHILEYFQNLDLKIIFTFIFSITILFFYIFYRKRSRKLIIAYSIATTGFFGMLANLILIFSFQIFYGYLYHRIGMLISIFMAGIAAGSIFMTASIKKIKNESKLFIGLEGLIIAFSYIMALTITRFLWSGSYAFLIFMALFFVSGLLMGLEFPLAGKIYIGDKGQVGEATGALYGSDLIGGWIAGVLGGIVLLPVLGLLNTCMTIVVFKLSSLFLLLVTKRMSV